MADGSQSTQAGELVEVGFLDGNVRTGRLAAFAPTMTELLFDFDRFGRTFVCAENIAYIGFVGTTRQSIRPGDSRATERLKVHVAGGRCFTVNVSGSQLNGNLGFRGHPVESKGPFGAIFFYRHGVNAREKDVPLGEMLVKQGLVAEQSLKRGLVAHAAQSMPPVAIGEILVEQGAVEPSAVERAAGLQARRKMRIGQILVESGLATEEAIDRALQEQKLRKGKRLGQVLVDMGLVREVDLTVTLGHKFQIPVVDLDDSRIDPVAASQVPRDVIEKYGVLPIATSSTNITVAISDPLAVDAIEVLRFHTKRKIDEVLVTPSQLAKYVASFLDVSEEHTETHQFADLLKGLRADDLSAEIEEEEPKNGVVTGEADSGIIRLVNQIIIDACRRGASDIHVEPNGSDRDVGIRFRIDGECSTYQSIPAAYRNQVLARIKIMAGLDISERRKPQDGKIKFKVGNRNIELRVATLPTAGRDEDAVLRILASAGPLPLEKMGLSARNLRELHRAIKTPYGLVLCVGPTGSGKTTTLHAALGALNTADTKIWTAEDPVEITQPGLRQVQVSPKIGLTFAATLRAFLRADPDVIMIGEMRDLETASTAVEASLTGHLVLSTLHTNSAPETITRLLDMGLDPFSFADSLVAILAQRLTRALCRHCRTLAPATDMDRAELARACGGEDALRSRIGSDRWESLDLYRATGCEKCGDTGYKGRLALHELLVVSDPIRHAVAQKAGVETLRRLAQSEGMTTLLEDGVEKILSGETDLKQVFAACVK